MLDSVNALRAAQVAAAAGPDARLNAAAATHSRDMSVQNRPWHFGSDGSSPLDRVQRVGYTGQLVGELISETYETELETLSAWMEQPDTRAVIMDPCAQPDGLCLVSGTERQDLVDDGHRQLRPPSAHGLLASVGPLQ